MEKMMYAREMEKEAQREESRKVKKREKYFTLQEQFSFGVNFPNTKKIFLFSIKQSRNTSTW
jgi:hypothetical protein